MNLPDKLPFIDPNVRGIYDVLIAAAEQIRKDRRTHEFRESEKRMEQARGDRQKMREREAKERREEREWEAARLAGLVTVPTFLKLREGQKVLSLRD